MVSDRQTIASRVPPPYQQRMLRAIQLALLFVFPVAILIASIAIDRIYGLPGHGDGYVLRIDLPPLKRGVGLPDVQGPADASRPLVVIDAGHGGHDPGAVQGRTREKDVTLAIARAIRDDLLDRGGIRVAMTREDDRFLLLEERSAIARGLKADLFISVHADSAENETARGASVYVLSQKGSSEAAARFAARENRADLVNGVSHKGQSDAVSTILLDLSQSEMRGRSSEMAQLVLRELSGQTKLHTDTVQSAAFAVLKAPDVPSVLFEMGYISNKDDAEFLSTPQGRRIISDAASRAIRAYFARQTGA